MSDFLARLSRRAAGPVLDLHPRARLRFEADSAAPRSGPPASAQEPRPISTPGSAEDQTATSKPARDWTRAAADVERREPAHEGVTPNPSRHGHNEVLIARRPGETSARHTSPEPAAVEGGEIMSSRRPEPAAQPRAKTAPVPRRVTESPAVDPAPQRASSRDAAPLPFETYLDRAPAPAPRRNGITAGGDDEAGAPWTQMPAQLQTRESARTAGTALAGPDPLGAAERHAPRGDARAAAPEPVRVDIEIGRIELRTPREPTPARPRAQAPPLERHLKPRRGLDE